MKNANEILKGSKAESKAVIFFTDGVPTSGSQFENGVANAAIGASYTLKNETKAKVYSIGVFDGADPSKTDDVNKYMNAVSSNYPEATKLDNMGTKASNANYYTTASNAGELNKIFQSISQDIVSTTYNFGKETIVQDVMSEHFVVNGEAGDIKAYTSDYKGSGDFDKREAAPDDVTATVADGVVQVTGFDFEPVVDKTPVSGKKLIIEIPVKLTEKAMKEQAGETVFSNNTAEQTASIIDGGKVVKEFNKPSVTLPAKAVEKKDLVIKIYGKDKTVPYNGKEQSVEGFTTSELPEGVTLELTRAAKAKGTNAGTYEMGLKGTDFEISGAEQYRDKYNISWKVVKDGSLTIEPVEVVVKADDKTKKKGEENPEFTGTFTGFVGDDTAESLGLKATYSTEATKDSPAGKYTIRVERNIETQTNYNFAYIDGTLTVTDDTAVAPTDNTDKTAKTGDDFQIGLIAGVALLALAGAGAVLFTRRKKTN